MKYKLLLIALVLAVSLYIVEANPLCSYNSPIGAWNLNITTTVNDCSGKERDLTNSGAVGFNDEHAIFNENSYLNHANTTYTNFDANPFSVCLNASYNDTKGVLAGHYYIAGANGWWLYYDGVIRFAVGAGGVERANLPAATNNNKFYYYCGVRNTTHVTIYTDGRYNVSVTNNNNANPTTAQAFRIGDSTSVSGGIWRMDGNVRDVTLYDFALSTQEVKDIYDKNIGPPTPPSDNLKNITIITPNASTYHTNNPLNFTFNINGFNASACFIEFNDSVGTCTNITVGGINETIFSNVTIEEQNFTDVLNWYNFEEGNGSTAIDIVNNNNATNTAATYNNSKGGNNTGNYSLFFDTAFLFASDKPYYDFGTSGDFSIAAWIRTDDTDSQYHMILDNRDLASDGIFLAIDSLNHIQVAVDATTFSSSTTITDHGWHHVVATVDRDNAANTDIYIDGSPESVGVTTSSQNVDVTVGLFIGRRSFSAGTYWEGDLDNVMLFNKSLSSSEITDLYNTGRFRRFNETQNTTVELNQTINSSDRVELLCSFPANTRNKDFSYYINCTETNTDDNITSDVTVFEYDNDLTPPTINVIFPPIFDTYNIDMWINASLSESATCSVNNSAFVEYQANSTYFSTNESTLSDGFYSNNLSCTDSSQNNNTASVKVDFTKDITKPDITFVYPLEDNSTVYINTGFVTIEWNTQDDISLYNYQFNVTVNSTGELRHTESANISGTNYTFLKTFNTSIVANETMLLTVRVCDSHTKNKIKEATGIVKTKSKLKYQFDSTFINVEALDSDVKKSDTKYLNDRYDFKFNYDNSEQYRIFKLSSNKHINYLPNSPYKGHFVIGEHWIDFEGYNNVLVEKENETYIITVEVNGSKNIHFKSVGELNCNVKAVTVRVQRLFGYTLDLIKPTNWFNTELLNLDTTAGVLVFALLILIVISLIAFAEIVQIPIFAIVAALSGMTLGVLIFVSLSAVLGAFVTLVSIMYIGRGIFMAR